MAEKFDGDIFYRKWILPEEEQRNLLCPRPWNASYRWFRSPNIIDLWNYRSAAEKQRVIEHVWRRQGCGFFIGFTALCPGDCA